MYDDLNKLIKCPNMNIKVYGNGRTVDTLIHTEDGCIIIEHDGQDTRVDLKEWDKFYKAMQIVNEEVEEENKKVAQRNNAVANWLEKNFVNHSKEVIGSGTLNTMNPFKGDYVKEDIWFDNQNGR